MVSNIAYEHFTISVANVTQWFTPSILILMFVVSSSFSGSATKSERVSSTSRKPNAKRTQRTYRKRDSNLGTIRFKLYSVIFDI